MQYPQILPRGSIEGEMLNGKMDNQSEDFRRFDSAITKLLSVPRSVLLAREAE